MNNYAYDCINTPDISVSSPDPKQYCSEDCDTCRVPLNKCPGSYEEMDEYYG